MACKNEAFKLQANEAQTCLRQKMTALGYAGAITSLKEDDVPTLFTVLEAMLTPEPERSQRHGQQQQRRSGQRHVGLANGNNHLEQPSFSYIYHTYARVTLSKSTHHIIIKIYKH